MAEICPECLGSGVWRECWESDGKACKDLLWCEPEFECRKCGKVAWGAPPKKQRSTPPPPKPKEQFEPVPKSKNKKGKKRRK